MRRTNVWLKLSQIRELKSLARETGAPSAFWVRRAIDELLDRRKAEKGKVNDHGANNEKSE